MSPLERSVLRRIVDSAGRRWTVRIRPVAVESIVCQMHTTTTTTTTLYSLLPPAAQRRMQAAVRRQRGVRLSVSEAAEIRCRASGQLELLELEAAS